MVRSLRRPGAPALARGGVRDHAGGGHLALPAPRARPPRPARARLGAGRRPRHGRPCCVRRPRREASPSSRAASHGVVAAAAGGRHVDVGQRGGAPQRRLQRPGRRRRRLDRGRGRVARRASARSGRPRGRSCISASRRETGEWPIVQPLLTHYLVPWPGGRVACGGTFEAGAGFSVTVDRRRPPRAAARVPARRAGPGGAPTYLETRVGLRPTSADDRALVGPVAGLGQRLGRHRARRQRPAAGPVLGPGAGARHGGRAAARRTRRRCRRRSTRRASAEVAHRRPSSTRPAAPR